MKKISFNQGALLFALLMILIAIGAMIASNQTMTGISLILTCIALSYGIKLFQVTKGLSFTMWIIASVCIAMFFPQFFIAWGDFKLSKLITPLLQIIMFGMGAQMSLNDFKGVLKMPKGVAIGFIGHYTVAPLLAFLIVLAFPAMRENPEIAVGIILVGAVPSGIASNVMTMLANGNMPLTITMSAVITLAAPFVTPFLMQIFGGQFVDVNAWAMMLSIFTMMILPIIAGFIFNLFFLDKEDNKTKTIQMVSYVAVVLLAGLIGLKVNNAGVPGYLEEMAFSLSLFILLPTVAAMLLKRALKGDQSFIKKVLGKLSQIGIFTIVLVITAAGRESLMTVGALLLVLIILHNLAGYTLGYYLSRLLGMNETDSRTIAFEVGMPNGGLASGLALSLGNIATYGLAPAIYGPIMNITGSTIASIWKGRPPKDLQKNKENKIKK